MAFRSCALETVKESVVLEQSSAEKFPADQEMVKSLVGKTTGDCVASNTDSAELSLRMGFAVIVVEIVDCLGDFHQLQLSHRSVCASTMKSPC